MTIDDHVVDAPVFKAVAEPELRTPRMWVVVLHNDDITPFDYVVELLVRMFDKTTHEATDLAYQTHEEGRAVVDICTREIAETKSHRAKELSRSLGFPLIVTAEES